MALLCVLAAFIVIGHLGPDVGTTRGLIIQVLTQKAMAAGVLIALWVASREGELAAATLSRSTTAA